MVGGTGFGVVKVHLKSDPETVAVKRGTLNNTPPHTIVFSSAPKVKTGFGFTSIAYSNGKPSQPFEVGITLNLIVLFVLLGFVNVIARRFPVPEFGAPAILPVFELTDQRYVDAITLVQTTLAVLLPEQID